MTTPADGPAAEPQDDQTPATTGHGDPLLDSAQGRGEGDDGSRHGHDATGSVPPSDG
jgi:hypothetical protein